MVESEIVVTADGNIVVSAACCTCGVVCNDERDMGVCHRCGKLCDKCERRHLCGWSATPVGRLYEFALGAGRVARVLLSLGVLR